MALQNTTSQDGLTLFGDIIDLQNVEYFLDPKFSSILPNVITAEYLKDKLLIGLNASHVAIVDLTVGNERMFESIIVSGFFENKTTQARNEMVHFLLHFELARIHAWTSKCYTPAEWDRIKRSENYASMTFK